MPKHIAIIPDGNRRWAKQQSESRDSGHRAGANRPPAAIQKNTAGTNACPLGKLYVSTGARPKNTSGRGRWIRALSNCATASAPRHPAANHQAVWRSPRLSQRHSRIAASGSRKYSEPTVVTARMAAVSAGNAWPWTAARSGASKPIGWPRTIG